MDSTVKEDLQCEGCVVTYVDLSAASAAMARARVAHRKLLHRVRFVLKPLQELQHIEGMRGAFDLVVCSGVLHHQRDPVAALRSLRALLEPSHGAMAIMVYARYI